VEASTWTLATSSLSFLKPEYAGNEEMQARFLNEGKRQALLNHANSSGRSIFLKDEGRHFLVIQYVERGSLQDLLGDKPGPLPLTIVVPLMLHVLSALDYAHEQG